MSVAPIAVEAAQDTATKLPLAANRRHRVRARPPDGQIRDTATRRSHASGCDRRRQNCQPVVRNFIGPQGVQNFARTANCTASDRPTQSPVRMSGEGLVRYAPDPKFPFSVTTLTRFVRLNTSARPSTCARPPHPERTAQSRAQLKKSGPMPAFRSMNAPFTIGRPAVPWMVVTPDVMLNGSAE